MAHKMDLNCLKYGYGHYGNIFRSIKNNVPQFFRNLKYAYQRATRGYCDRDIWSLDSYYSALFYITLNRLADISCGYPGVNEFSDEQAKADGWTQDENSSAGYKRWISALRELADHFYNCGPFNENLELQKEADKYFDEMSAVSELVTEAIPNSELVKLATKVSESEKYEEAKKKWLDSEAKLKAFRINEKEIAFDLMKKYFYDLWD